MHTCRRTSAMCACTLWNIEISSSCIEYPHDCHYPLQLSPISSHVHVIEYIYLCIIVVSLLGLRTWTWTWKTWTSLRRIIASQAYLLVHAQFAEGLQFSAFHYAQQRCTKLYTWHHPSILFCCFISQINMKDIGMVSCSFVYLWCVIAFTLLVGASSHPYIPLHFEEMI